MKAFRVAGEFLMGRKYQKFSKEVAAQDEEKAVERVLSLLGSKHGTKRKDIRIQSVAEVAQEDIVDPVVGYLLRMG